MAAKLTFDDIENAELDISKLKFDSGLDPALASGTVNPSADSPVGSLFINTSSGSLFRKTASGGSNWVQISSVTNTNLVNRYRNMTINSAVTSTDGTAPSVGDLVAICGVGAWAASGNLNTVKAFGAGDGNQTAAFVAGGITAGGRSPTTELFNGSTWAASGNISVPKEEPAASSSQNAGLVFGGFTSARTNLTELFNGSVWSTGGVLNVATSDLGGAGTQNATASAGGASSGGNKNQTELFNGSAWSNSNNMSIAKIGLGEAGSLNSGLVAGGQTSAKTAITEFFNGSSWLITGNIATAKSYPAVSGSQSSAFCAGGLTASANIATEIFNGSVWVASGNLSFAKGGCGRAGSQNAGLVAGGSTDGSGTGSILVTELHSQTIYRKVLFKNSTDCKNIGILSTTNSVILQGTNTSITYPANKYFSLNRGLNSSTTNNTSLTSVAFGSVLGTAPTMTYNLSSATNLLTVIPGMVVIVTSGGANPVSAANAGTFIISRVISPTSIEVTNASGVAQNPGSGTLSFISTMVASDSITPQDIVIGKTDNNGLLTIQKPLTIGSLIKRLK